MTTPPLRRASLDPVVRTDADLLRRIAEGDLAPLGPLFDRHGEAVRRLVSRLGVRPGDVDDLVQSTFLDVIGVAASYDGRPNARGWLSSLAAMRVRRHRRSFARLAARLFAFGHEPTREPVRPDVETMHRASARRAASAFDALSDKKREVFVLVALEGLTCDEAAEALRIPVGTVWTRLHHERSELRAALAEEIP